MSVQTGIVAHAGGGQGSAIQLTAMNCFIATVATAGDSVKLPPSKPGMEITVINQSATATGPNVFPATDETINALAANTAIAVPPQTVMIFFLRDKRGMVDKIGRSRPRTAGGSGVIAR
jgi:hypothetical protein